VILLVASGGTAARDAVQQQFWPNRAGSEKPPDACGSNLSLGRAQPLPRSARL